MQSLLIKCGEIKFTDEKDIAFHQYMLSLDLEKEYDELKLAKAHINLNAKLFKT